MRSQSELLPVNGGDERVVIDGDVAAAQRVIWVKLIPAATSRRTMPSVPAAEQPGRPSDEWELCGLSLEEGGDPDPAFARSKSRRRRTTAAARRHVIVVDVDGTDSPPLCRGRGGVLVQKLRQRGWEGGKR